jgi:hypothetical protein
MKELKKFFLNLCHMFPLLVKKITLRSVGDDGEGKGNGYAMLITDNAFEWPSPFTYAKISLSRINYFLCIGAE